MRFEAKQISSLLKICSDEDYYLAECNNSEILFAGEEYSYQIAFKSTAKTEFTFEIKSEIKDYITLYLVREVVMDMPIYDDCKDENYLTKDAGSMSDMLSPLEKQHGLVQAMSKPFAIWVKVDIPSGLKGGIYPINIIARARENEQNYYEKIVFDEMCLTFNVEVLNTDLPEQKTLFTQWFHTDCIASAHNVAIYSEKHWELIDKYMALAAELGINTILTPAITPPLDVEVGRKRPDVQLVKIIETDNGYTFDFSLLKRWIELAKKTKSITLSYPICFLNGDSNTHLI